MKAIIENFNSKKLAALAGIVTTILQVDAKPEWTVAALVAAGVGYFVSDAIQNRVTKAVQGAQAGLDIGKEAKGGE